MWKGTSCPSVLQPSWKLEGRIGGSKAFLLTLNLNALEEIIMPSWKCKNCGYALEANKPPEECPSCKQKCEFMDNSCYTPDCQAEGIDKRIK